MDSVRVRKIGGWTAPLSALSLALLLIPSQPLASVHIQPPVKGNGYGKPALQGEQLGLDSGEDFRLTTGRCEACSLPPAVRWYFQDEVIAVPRESGRFSPFIWIGAPEILEHVTLLTSGGSVATAEGAPVRLALAPKTPDNRSYYDQSSTAYFRGRPLRMRGTTLFPGSDPVFVARTIWPEDFRIEPEALRVEAVLDERTLDQLIEAQMDGVPDPLYIRVLWERQPGAPRRWAGHPVLALVLSGAQADDDESHAGHLSIATGRLGPHGEWADWIVNNFYPLDKVDEKEILAGMVPMDDYLMNLNSGQAYYRPHYLVAVIFRHELPVRSFQTAIQQVYPRFYCHQISYDLVTMNSTAFQIDTLREIGWKIPHKGDIGFLKAVLAYVYVAVTERNLDIAANFFQAFIEEKTRIAPRIAFEAATTDLLRLLSRRTELEPQVYTPYERMLQEHAEALLFLRVPQVPSSRPFGTFPVKTLQGYRLRVPDDRSQWKIAPEKLRPFPAELHEPCRSFLR